jgi:hypothetical protein
MRYGITIVIYFSLIVLGRAQTSFTARLDSTSMILGDQQNLTLTYIAPSNAKAADFHIENIDTCSFLDVISRGTWIRTEQNNIVKLEKKLRFSIFDEGTFIIPSVTARLGDDSIVTNTLPIQIKGVEPDSTGLLPIKGIITEKARWSDYMGWYIAILSLALLYGLYRYYQYRLKSNVIHVEPTPEVILLPHEIAIQKLLELKHHRLWEKGEVKEFHVQLTFILREYLENRFNIPALESTSNEIIRDLKLASLSADQMKTVDQILNIADWVKFAKGIPEENANALALDNTLDLVYATKSEYVEEPSNQTEPA